MDFSSGMQILDRTLHLHQHLCERGVKAGDPGLYFTCYTGDGASGRDIAQNLSQAIPVEVKVVAQSQGQDLLGVFLTKPPRQLQVSEVVQHVIWGKRADIEAEFCALR